jgi:hypothetical protein
MKLPREHRPLDVARDIGLRADYLLAVLVDS